jgi:hypothetical protein
MLSVLANGRKLMIFDTLSRKNLKKRKLPSGIIIKHTQNKWMTGELKVEWLRQVCGRNYMFF